MSAPRVSYHRTTEKDLFLSIAFDRTTVPNDLRADLYIYTVGCSLCQVFAIEARETTSSRVHICQGYSGARQNSQKRDTSSIPSGFLLLQQSSRSGRSPLHYPTNPFVRCDDIYLSHHQRSPEFAAVPRFSRKTRLIATYRSLPSLLETATSVKWTNSEVARHLRRAGTIPI